VALAGLCLLAACGRPDRDPGADPGAAAGAASDETGDDPGFHDLGAFGYADFGEEDAEADAGLAGVVLYDRERSAPGYNLYVDIPFSAAYLIDAAGERVRAWREADDTTWVRAVLLDGGNLAVIGTGPAAGEVPEGGERQPFVARFGWEGAELWRLEIAAHHDLDVLPTGDLLVLTERWSQPPGEYEESGIRENVLTRISPGGEILGELALYDLLAREEGLLRWTVQESKEGWPADLLHLNSVRWVDRPDLPADSPLSGTGRVLLSSRHQDLVFVVDWNARALLWSWGRGVVQRQHEATVLESGNVLLFDNGSKKRRWSRILELDPRTERIVWEYRADPPEDFYSSGRGTAQALPGGNVLVGNSASGEAFEVTREGKIVWRFLNPSRSEESGGRAALRIARYPVERVERIRAERGER